MSLLDPPEGMEWINVSVSIDHQLGGRTIVDECFAIASDDPKRTAIEQLRAIADRLERR